ncbi:hypothetical protein BDC45DRAFT_571278 [Circinella umbellata]|nr:hypothetical protein BDC45DRAFT_571278 [Circinella umbellata]
MYSSPTTNRLRDATASVRTRSPLGTPPLSAAIPPTPSSPFSTQQERTTVTGSPIVCDGSTTPSSSSDQLNNIFNAVRQQIQKWGDNAKWKIDLVLLDNSQNNNRQDSPSLRSHQQQQQPQNLRVTTAVGNQGYMLPVSNSTQYPMDYTAQTAVPNDMYTEELRQQLHDSLERQRYLENIVRTQADQIHYSQSFPPDANKAIETMRSIYMMSENEQKLRYLVDTKVLHKDMEALSRKLRRITSTLHSIETMELPPQDSQLSMETLLEERKILKRKLHLAELRLSARDAELEYLHNLNQQEHPSFYPHYETNSSIRSPKPQQLQQQHNLQSQPQQQQQQQGQFGSSPKRGPPYLFQQQYSPKMRHDIKPPSMQQQKNQNNDNNANNLEQQQHHISALESLGIVADRMLNDPGFTTPQEKKQKSSGEATTTTLKKKKSKGQDSPNLENINRSKRSIDSANTLLSMPTTLMFPSQSDEKKDITMEEGNAQNMGQEKSSKKARIEQTSLRETNDSSNSSNYKQEPDARQSPSIAALLDQPSPTSSPSSSATTKQQQRHFSPHTTPPLASSQRTNNNVSEETSSTFSTPGYRPPSPASTPKRRRRSTQDINRTNNNNTTTN